MRLAKPAVKFRAHFAENREAGNTNPPSLLAAKLPPGQRRQFASECRSSVCHCLIESAGQYTLQELSISRPSSFDESIDDHFGVISYETIAGSGERVLIAPSGLADRKCRLYQHQRLRCLGPIKGELQRDHATVGVTDNMRPVYTQMPNQLRKILRVFLDAYWSDDRGTNPIPAAVIVNQPEVILEFRISQ